jgi:flavin reductase (DIM6/NTAB) family NADH-FMN oxidoreductase RutF
MICPLHGFVWRKNLRQIISKYVLWSGCQPEKQGVMIAYASVYGNTENAAEILASELRESSVETVMFDVSVTPSSEIISAAFKYSHLIFASTTYNAGIFVTMENVISDLVAHNIQNRTIGIIENGSWAATSGNLIREKLQKCKNIKFIENIISIKSSLKEPQLSLITQMAQKITEDFPEPAYTDAMFKLPYGLYALTVKDNGCIINTVMQIMSQPNRISVAINKTNFTHDLIKQEREFDVNILTENTPFDIIGHFGFRSGKDVRKDVTVLTGYVNAVISAKITDAYDYETHTLFIADVVKTSVLSDEPSLTYQYYRDNIKPNPQAKAEEKNSYVCKICGYIYSGDTLPDDYICPLCKHGAADFEKQ